MFSMEGWYNYITDIHVHVLYVATYTITRKTYSARSTHHTLWTRRTLAERERLGGEEGEKEGERREGGSREGERKEAR